ncbi:MAG: hypothetical protein NTX50_24265 [Candidatus Sumerlaeota bacterium]|nr:hypothetical protein [Candidatus Sumerlaeota bacterium]
MSATSLFLLCLWAAVAQEFPISPYADPAQLDCPWPKMSHYKQPWRGYLETRPGVDFLNGIGVNLHIPNESQDLAIRLLAETGIRTFRIEIGWGSMAWDETKFNGEESLRRKLELCARYNIRPTLLLNAHQGVPCPVKFFNRRLVADAPLGSRSVRLNNAKDLVVGRSGLSELTTYWAAEALITRVDEASGEVWLSKPLPKELKASDVKMATLKYAPLHPVGMPEFDETATGWTRYALRACRLAREAGVKDFDIEIWNELTFGTHFLNINDYYDKAAPKISGKIPDFLNRGGSCWELARRTVEAVKKESPAVRCIWGFSNTTFYHCKIENLPAGMDGQSYHPYGTGTRAFDGKPPRKDQPPVEGFVPMYEIRMMEGWAPTFIQTECLIRLLRPDQRLTQHPAGVSRFYHYMTEHGVLAKECGATDEAGAWRLKTLCALRSYCLWLNKGMDALHYFDAFEADPMSFGLLPANLKRLPADAKFEDVATPPMRAIRALTRAFEGVEPLAQVRAVTVEATALGEQTKIFEGDATHPLLWNREALAVLPFQVNARKHVIAVYVMTRDAVKPFAPARFRLKIAGAAGRGAKYFDPIENKSIPVESAPAGSTGVEVVIPVADYPRLLILE